jgi:hypothetical protein
MFPHTYARESLKNIEYYINFAMKNWIERNLLSSYSYIQLAESLEANFATPARCTDSHLLLSSEKIKLRKQTSSCRPARLLVSKIGFSDRRSLVTEVDFIILETQLFEAR